MSLCLVGMLTALGLWILGVPAPLSLGFVAGVLSFIPNFGPLLSLVPAVIVALPNGPQMVLYVILLYAGIQLVESYFITPLIQHRAVRLPPALILLAQILMGVLFGFLGLLLATPLTAVLLVLIKRLYIEDVLAEPGSKRGRAA